MGPLRVNLGPYVTDFTHVPSVRSLVDLGIWTFGAWGMEHLEDYRLILDYRKRRLLIHTPHADERLTEPGIVSIEHAEPELASRIGLR